MYRFPECNGSYEGLHKNRNLSPIIINNINQVFKLENDNNKISFTWIPGHAGINGNEQADQLANLARLDGEFLNIALPISDIYNIIKNKSLTKWQQQWAESSEAKGGHLFKIVPIIPHTPWFT